MILDQIFKSNESWNGEISQGACLLAATYCSFLLTYCSLLQLATKVEYTQ